MIRINQTKMFKGTEDKYFLSDNDEILALLKKNKKGYTISINIYGKSFKCRSSNKHLLGSKWAWIDGLVYRICKGSPQRGYYKLQLKQTDGTSRTCFVHRIVYFTHNDIDLIDGYTIDHIDRNKSDNRISNLRYINHKENLLNRDSKVFKSISVGLRSTFIIERYETKDTTKRHFKKCCELRDIDPEDFRFVFSRTVAFKSGCKDKYYNFFRK